jgi:DNA modification methylase
MEIFQKSRIHKATPLIIFKNLPYCFSSPGDTILEYCAGSGIGLIAAVERNRNYLGFDNNETQFRVLQFKLKSILKNLTKLKKKF